LKTGSGSLPTGTHYCKCGKTKHATKLVVLTGGPGGGKTAVLEMARRYFCQHVAITPEAASIVFGDGFPRSNRPQSHKAAQRAIFHVQRAIETVALETRRPAVILCDRGTLDGLAYWPGSRQSFFSEFGLDPEAELQRYAAIVHLEVPALAWGYEKNRIRREDAAEAHEIDRRIGRAWKGHPRVLNIGAQAGFLDKLATAIELLRDELPACCRTHLHALSNGVPAV
jgi:predicted ATPase